jgi:hypothetical protein
VQVTRTGGLAAFESSDGQFLYYTKIRGITSLWKAPVGGGPEIRVADALFYLNFALAEDGVYFVQESCDGRRPCISFMSYGGNTPKNIGAIESTRASITSVNVSPDRQWLLYARWETGGRDLMMIENFR